MEPMLREDHRMPRHFQPIEQRAEAHHRFAVQICGRLIQDDNLRLHCTDGGNGDKLLFAAGQREYPSADQAFNVHLFANRVQTLLHDWTLQWDVLHPQHNLIRRVGGEKLAARVLKDASHHRPQTMDGHFQCVLTVKGVAALQLSRIKAGAKPVENTGQRRLAAAASAGQDHQLALFYMKVDTSELSLCFT